MHSPAILAMQNAIIQYIKSQIPKDTNKAKVGIISGNRVIIDNQSYRFDPVTDDYFANGSRVYCVTPNSGRTAAIVGVV